MCIWSSEIKTESHLYVAGHNGMTGVQIYDQGTITQLGSGYASYINQTLEHSCAEKLDEDKVLFIGGETDVLLIHTISSDAWEKKKGIKNRD